VEIFVLLQGLSGCGSLSEKISYVNVNYLAEPITGTCLGKIQETEKV